MAKKAKKVRKPLTSTETRALDKRKARERQKRGFTGFSREERSREVFGGSSAASRIGSAALRRQAAQRKAKGR